MLKIIPPGSFDFGEPPIQLLRVGSKSARLEKHAYIKHAYDFLERAISRDPPKPGEVPIFLIALGAGEVFGPNRNGDYFSKRACAKYHSTFVKHAYFFRSHRNSDPRKSYGIVKASRFNEEAARIELIVYLNGDQTAAKRNKGLVADKELEALESGKEIPVSMSCKVPYDECSGCGHQSKSRDEYCDETICITYGGLKKNLGKTFDDGHTLCALNPICDWFDISHVAHPADRTAYVLGEISLEKKASGAAISGAELAEILGLKEPAWLFQKTGQVSTSWQLQTLARWADWDRQELFQKTAFCLPWPPPPSHALRDEGPLRFLWSSIKHGCLVPFSVFAQTLGCGAPTLSDKAFLKLASLPSHQQLIAANPYKPEDYLDIFAPFFEHYKAQLCVTPDNLIKSAAVQLLPVRNRQADEPLNNVSKHYCLYKLAFAEYWAKDPNVAPYIEQIVYLFN